MLAQVIILVEVTDRLTLYFLGYWKSGGHECIKSAIVKGKGNCAGLLYRTKDA